MTRAYKTRAVREREEKEKDRIAAILRERLARAVATDPALADLRELEPQLKRGDTK